MTMKLSEKHKELKNYSEKRKTFLALVQDEGATQEAQKTAYAEMIDALTDDCMAAAEAEGMRAAENKFNELQKFGGTKLSSDEIKFFNSLDTDVGYKEELLLPQQTIDRIFEDLTESHPLLTEIGLQNAGLRLKFIRSEVSGTAVWGKIYGEIKGQLDAAFAEDEDIQNKLTAFVVVPNDLTEMGPGWVERFVRTQIVEAFSLALVLAYVNGDGNDKPIGLRKDVSEGVTVTGGVYPDKSISGTLTFKDADSTIKELTEVMNSLSVKENSKRITVDGKVLLICNPSQAWALKAQYTIQNANGAFITALPFNVKVVEAEGVPENEVIALVRGRYDAYIGGGTRIKKFDQTLAIEDCTLYTAKTFAHGKARDNKAALLYELDLEGLGA